MTDPDLALKGGAPLAGEASITDEWVRRSDELEGDEWRVCDDGRAGGGAAAARGED